MRSISVLLSLLFTASIFAPVAAEASYYSTRNRDWRFSTERPSHRSIEHGARNYRRGLASGRRAFKRDLQQIERVRDERRDEYRRAEAEAYDVDEQGFVPYHWFRTRRHVRHLYWKNHFQELPDAKTGEGHAAQEDEETEE